MKNLGTSERQEAKKIIPINWVVNVRCLSNDTNFQHHCQQVQLALQIGWQAKWPIWTQFGRLTWVTASYKKQWSVYVLGEQLHSSCCRIVPLLSATFCRPNLLEAITQSAVLLGPRRSQAFTTNQFNLCELPKQHWSRMRNWQVLLAMSVINCRHVTSITAVCPCNNQGKRNRDFVSLLEKRNLKWCLGNLVFTAQDDHPLWLKMLLHAFIFSLHSPSSPAPFCTASLSAGTPFAAAT